MTPGRRAAPGRRSVAVLGVVLVAAGLLAIVLGLRANNGQPAPSATPAVEIPITATMARRATAIPERLIPTAGATPSAGPHAQVQTSTPAASDRPASVRTPAPPASGTPGSTAGPKPTAGTAAPSARPGSLSCRQRIGFTVPQGDVRSYDVARLGAGWYLTGEAEVPAGSPAGLEFVPLVEVLGSTYSPGPQELRALAGRRPGALWLVGNEPDVIWQDNATPDEYAQVYHDVYLTLKGADPTCRVAFGGVAQVTPLRVRYLESILAAYQERYGQAMPVDVWNVHLAILREERGSWGVDIPPGLADDRGVLYEIEDNADVEILKSQVRTMRRWMAEHGFRDRPLIVTEFSVLMPSEYGFDAQAVQTFMAGALDFFLAATDDETGYPPDGNRLVQRAAWYSLADTVYATGNLFDPHTRQITPLGLAFAAYIAGR